MKAITDMIINDIKRQMRIYVTITFMILPIIKVKCQDVKAYPRVGMPVPEFTFTDVDNAPGKIISAANLKGKYIILDFWATYCAACIAGFPKMNQFQETFRDSLQIILVGFNDGKRDVRAFYNKYKSKFDLNITAVFDSTTMLKLVPGTIPHFIWINKDGVIKAITGSNEVTEANIKQFISDVDFKYLDASYEGSRRTRAEIDLSKPQFFTNGSADTNYLYRSVLSKWSHGMGASNCPSIDFYIKTFGKSMYQASRVPLTSLFKMAYFGTLSTKDRYEYPYPILECKDSLLFKYDDSGPTSGLYNYSTEVPIEQGNTDKLMKVMQGDLKNYFGLNPEIEQREMPCYNLIVINKDAIANLKAGSQKPSINWNVEDTRNEINNVSMDFIPTILTKNLPFKVLEFNETGLSIPVSFAVNGAIDDLENIRKEIRKVGLDLVPGKRKFKVLVIKD